MARKRKVTWEFGVVFAVPLPDGTFGVGQAIAAMMANVSYCAFTRLRVGEIGGGVPSLLSTDVVSRVPVTREQLDYAAWPILGVAPLCCAKSDFAAEDYANRGYVGATIYDAALAEDFLAAFHAFAAWDDWHQPDYLNRWLVSPNAKSQTLRWKDVSRTAS
jgi:hypothetical protein